MKRRVLIVGSVFLVAALACVVGFISIRPAWPVAKFGPHMADISWIPYEATKAEPIIDFSLFGKKFRYPESHPLVPESEPECVSGFIKLPTSTYASLKLPNGDRVDRLQNGLIAVPWARSPKETEYILEIFNASLRPKSSSVERVRVQAPYRKGTAASKYGLVKTKIAGIDFEGTIARFNHLDGAFLYGRWAGPRLEKGRIMSEYDSGSALYYLVNAPSTTFTLVGQKKKTGEIVFKGAIAADNLKRTPYQFTVLPSQ